MSEKLCPHCGAVKPLADFYRNPKYAAGVTSWCRACIKANSARVHERVRGMHERGELPVPTEKLCPCCRQVKPAVEFHRSGHRRDGLTYVCARCMAAQRREAAYGATPEVVSRLMVKQGGVCAICGQQFGGKRRQCVDHDHATGAVRGLLCSSCNTILGMAEDSRDTLLAAASYLERNRQACA